MEEQIHMYIQTVGVANKPPASHSLSTSEGSHAVRAASQCTGRMALLYAVSLLVQRDLRAGVSRKSGLRSCYGVASHFSRLSKQRVRHFSTVRRGFISPFHHTLWAHSIHQKYYKFVIRR